MNDFSESLVYNRISPVVSNFSEYRRKAQNRKKKPKKEYSEIMKKVDREIENSGDNEHINLKI